ncbi:MAG: alpha-keto acid decarboxylase family protein, partial [Armatimonadetes bacterium]|nr:alpha-keto acid decarboxylase family protein [Armatimonadota bacterium]
MPNMTIGDYLLQRLAELGVRHLFGVPGDFVLRFMTRVPEHGLELVNCCDEQGAGFAADAYARITGLGVVCVTYGVGGLKIANSTAQAFAERSPVVIISGAPGIGERAQHPLIHHRIRDFDTQRKVFEQLTVASAVLDDPETALPEIDRVLEAALRYKRPVYLELPRDRLAVKARHHHRAGSQPARSDAESLAAALDETIARVRQATQPVVVLGEEVHRFQLQETAVRLLREAGLPAAATILGKSVIDEDEPNYLGVYQGGIGREDVARFVESSDCVLLLGVMMTDVNLGIYTASLDRQKCIHAVAEKLSVGLHVYEDVLFEDFING